MAKASVTHVKQRHAINEYNKKNELVTVRFDSKMQFLTQQVNNIYASAAIEGLIQSLKHEITDFWETSKA